jgi:hypothetical protein
VLLLLLVGSALELQVVASQKVCKREDDDQSDWIIQQKADRQSANKQK